MPASIHNQHYNILTFVSEKLAHNVINLSINGNVAFSAESMRNKEQHLGKITILIVPVPTSQGTEAELYMCRYSVGLYTAHCMLNPTK